MQRRFFSEGSFKIIDLPHLGLACGHSPGQEAGMVAYLMTAKFRRHFGEIQGQYQISSCEEANVSFCPGFIMPPSNPKYLD